MCGRFTLTERDVEAVARSLGAELDRVSAGLHRPRWNVAPTDEHWVVVHAGGLRRMVRARFGLDGPTGNLVINARAETAAELRTFRRAWVEGRCLVPADGFYEWSGRRDARRPLWFHDPAGRLLTFAGLAAPRRDGLAFVILTVPANGVLRAVHDRMPALLSRDGAAAWLAGGDASLLAPAPEPWLASREVSPRVNAIANDGPELLEPPPPEAQLRLI